METSRSKRVSFDDEPLILVDEANNVIGHGLKAEVHAGDGMLHRAFSVFLFDDEGRVLLQQRSADKPLWPLFWSNSCCSHPRRGETEAEAARRRVLEELGLEADVEYVYTFTYHARFEDKGSEHETCSVFLGRARGEVVTNENEIAAVRWMSVAELDGALEDTALEDTALEDTALEDDALEDEALETDGASYTPWLKLEWARLRDEFAPVLAGYTSA